MQMVEPLALPYNPFHQIPNEVIAKIFYQGTEIWKEDAHYPPNLNRPRTVPFPDLVSEVCNHWRALANCTPELWTHIRPPTAEGCIALMSKWFERSKAMPVAVILDDRLWAANRGTTEVLSEILLSEIFHFLDQFAHRLHRLDVRLPFIPIEEIYEIASKASSLQQLSLCKSHPTRSIQNYMTVSVFHASDPSWLQQLVCLQRLRFCTLSLPITTQLTCLEVHSLCLKYSDAKILFGANCRLKFLILHSLNRMTGPIREYDSPIRVDSLCSIAISNNFKRIRSPSTEPNPPYFFSLLNMPNVSYLELDCDSNASLSTMFGKSLSAAKIDTLRIRNGPPISQDESESNEDVKILQSFSGLQSLELIRVSAKMLLDRITGGVRGLSRKPSMGSQMASIIRHTTSVANPTKGPEPTADAVWPKLRSVVLDTSIAEDVVCLISFIQRHQGVLSVELSTLAMRHLRFLRRKGETIITPPPIILVGRGSPFEGDEDRGTPDVEEWLENMVDLKLMRSTNSLLSIVDDGLSQLP